MTSLIKVGSLRRSFVFYSTSAVVFFSSEVDDCISCSIIQVLFYSGTSCCKFRFAAVIIQVSDHVVISGRNRLSLAAVMMNEMQNNFMVFFVTFYFAPL